MAELTKIYPELLANHPELTRAVVDTPQNYRDRNERMKNPYRNNLPQPGPPIEQGAIDIPETVKNSPIHPKASQ